MTPLEIALAALAWHLAVGFRLGGWVARRRANIQLEAFKSANRERRLYSYDRVTFARKQGAWAFDNIWRPHHCAAPVFVGMIFFWPAWFMILAVKGMYFSTVQRVQLTWDHEGDDE